MYSDLAGGVGFGWVTSFEGVVVCVLFKFGSNDKSLPTKVTILSKIR